ncbi:extracellular solute-binding protein [Williamsia sp. CHRR-6]|uniref:ABC transporter substrate-binding protein n=1 Tax=Williamsia sp. CHRR-6 TaxID=2835871 RepID=UPI001BDA32F6|nr:extracellular solute-binding protein [Williamsia sp. CHRR-6]MBT0566628.1 extracellular solute-binding protein [Williamsia sp. CHRR-6]
MQVHHRTSVASLVVITLMVTLAVLSGCSPSSRSDGRIHLSLWINTQSPTKLAALRTIVAGYQRHDPTTRITVEQRATDAHKQAMRQSSGTPAGPDIYWYWAGPGLGGALVARDVSLDLTRYYLRYGWTRRFTPDSMRYITAYGGYQGVPWTLQGQGLFYNRDLFARAGITSVPTTYAALVATAERLRAAGIVPLATGGTVGWFVMRLLDSLIETTCGAATHDALASGRASWAREPCVTTAFTELKRWGQRYLNKGFMGTDRDQAVAQFVRGRAAMVIEGNWFNTQVTDAGVNPNSIGVFSFPTGTGRTYGFGEAMYISARSRHPDQAAAFLDYATSTPVQRANVGVWSALSVNAAVGPSTRNALDQQWPPIYGGGRGLYLNSDQSFALDRTTEYWRIQDSVLTGLMSPAAAGPRFQEFIDAEQRRR